MSGLSKSLILKGLQCPRALWLTRNPPDFSFPEDPEREARFRAGTEVGQLAQQLFPGGIEVPYEGLSVPAQIARTQTLIDSGAAVVYEASFAFSAVFVKVDLLVRDGRAWQIHEVKMGTAVKEVNIDDVAVQRYVLEGCGLNISDCFLVHIDSSYVRGRDLEVSRLFHSEKISARVAARQPGVPEIVAELRATLREPEEPAIPIGPQCHAPYECDFIPWCWRELPADSVFELRGRGVDRFALYRRGIIHQAQIPREELNRRQLQQVEATLKQEDAVDREGLEAFLGSLWHPLCHLDFETFSDPVPRFPGTRPYQQIPFQFSVHRQPTPGADPQHADFLAPPGSDPRRALCERLLAVIPPEACVLTYNQAFEKRIIGELAALFPDLRCALQQRLENVRDLMVPFRERIVYRWPMRGSYSIKEVLPAMVPELSYKNLDIADGSAAMRAYRQLAALPPGAERDRIRSALREYCRLDTLAMVRILAVLENLAA